MEAVSACSQGANLGIWHQLDTTRVLSELGVDASQGLAQATVQQRQIQYGSNTLEAQIAKSPWRMLWEQLTASTILILLAAAFIAALLGDAKDTIAIVAIVVLTTVIGFNQEYRTGKAIEALRKLAVPRVKVLRDGQYQECAATELVPGDVVLLEAGNLIPADGRLIETASLRVQESALTGESVPVDKITTSLSEADLALGDRLNMVYRGTIVIYGRGRAVITATGMETELGRVAHLVESVTQEATPLQQRLDQLGQKLVLAVLVLTTIIFGLGLLRGEPLQLMFLTAVSIAVGVVPEGLPAIVTIALAIGAQRMLQHQALIRKLPAVETLGSVTVICSDKTGTLTENRMTVAALATADQHLTLPNSPLSPPADSSLSPSLSLLLAASALCNDTLPPLPAQPTAIEPAIDTKSPQQWLGDPTEVALVIAAAQAGFAKPDLDRALPRLTEIPFDSDRQCMTTLHPLNRSTSDTDSLPSLQIPLPDLSCSISYLTFTKGAVLALLDRTPYIRHKDSLEPLDAAWRDRILQFNQEFAQQGMRVLGVAMRQWQEMPEEMAPEAIEQDLIWLGLVGMTDPARPEAKTAVATCQAAGIRPVLITGDQPLVGLHIAQELGIASDTEIITGSDLHDTTIEELRDRVESVSVYARVSPEQKLKIVAALQQRGEIVAMTGDGVNDAPALRKADIGVAMGMSGTDVAKEAAEMVLLDDNFATIVAAVEEGRLIYDNIRKCIKYLLGGNSGEIWIMFLAPLLGMPLPLLPIQILWINLLSDGLPALALSVEPADPDLMQQQPHSPHESIFVRGMGRDIVWIGFLVGVVSLAAGYWYWRVDSPPWQTMLFTTLTFSETLIALAIRSERQSLLQIGLFSNLYLLGAIVLTLVLQLSVIYVPGLQGLFQTTSLSLSQLGISFGLSAIVCLIMELQKWALRVFTQSKFPSIH